MRKRYKLTDTKIKTLPTPANGQADYFDAYLPSFGVRVSHKGVRSFFVFDRVRGKLKRMTLGRYPATSLAEARQKARDWKADAEKGVDPVAENAKRAEAEQAAEAAAEQTTFGNVAEQFLASQGNRLRASTLRAYRGVLTGDAVANWKDRQIAGISRSDVSGVLDALDTRGLAASSNHALAAFRRFFNWAADRDLIEHSPVERIRARHPHAKRDRALSPDELAIVLVALGDDAVAKVMYSVELPPLHDLFKDFYRALILTGQRRAEVAEMTFAELNDLDDAEKAQWIIPSARTKNKREHIVPLSPAMVAILKRRKAIDERRAAARAKRKHEAVEPPPYVFAGRRYVPLSGFSKAKRELDARVATLCTALGRPALAAWTGHDLRRTAVTLMNEALAVPPHIVEAIVNHVSGVRASVAGVYNRALYLPERRKALNAWAAYVEKLEAKGHG